VKGLVLVDAGAKDPLAVDGGDRFVGSIQGVVTRFSDGIALTKRIAPQCLIMAAIAQRVVGHG
jgi:hypothetical protein